MSEIGATVAAVTSAGASAVDTIINAQIPSMSSSSVVTAGTVAAIVVSSTASLQIGSKILLDEGTANEEWSRVISIPGGSTFTAYCHNAHPTSPATSFTISGNYHRQIVVTNALTSDAGGYFNVSSGTPNGAAIGTLPTIYHGVELLIPINASITFLKAFSAPGSPPGAGTTVTYNGTGDGNPLAVKVALALGQNLYVTAMSGGVQASYY